MRRGGKAFHVTAGLGHDHLRGARPTPGMVHSRAMTSAWSAAWATTRSLTSQTAVSSQSMPEQLTQLGGVVGLEAAAQRTDQLGETHAPLGQLGEHAGTLAGDERLDHRPPGLGQRGGGDRADLDRCVLQHLLDALGLAGADLHQPLR